MVLGSGPVTLSSLCLSLALHGAGLAGLLWLGSGGGPSGEASVASAAGGSALFLAWVEVDGLSASPTPGPTEAPREIEPPPKPGALRSTPARVTPPEAPSPVAVASAPVLVAARAETAGPSDSDAAPAAAAAATGQAGVGPSAEAASIAGDGAAGALDRVARPLSEIRPRYPTRARRRGREADVVVDVHVDARGRVEDARLLRPAGGEFDRAALEAVRRARFLPAVRAGERVASRVSLRLHFRLER